MRTGNRIRKISLIFILIGIICSVIYGISICKYAVIHGILTIVIGIVISLILGTIFYGFGLIVYHVSEISDEQIEYLTEKIVEISENLNKITCTLEKEKNQEDKVEKELDDKTLENESELSIKIKEQD